MLQQKTVGGNDLALKVREYYSLPIEERFSTYNSLKMEEHFRRQQTLAPFARKEKIFPAKK